jgi:hypothetical protein
VDDDSRISTEQEKGERRGPGAYILVIGYSLVIHDFKILASNFLLPGGIIIMVEGFIIIVDFFLLHHSSLLFYARIPEKESRLASNRPSVSFNIIWTSSRISTARIWMKRVLHS